MKYGAVSAAGFCSGGLIRKTKQKNLQLKAVQIILKKRKSFVVQWIRSALNFALSLFYALWKGIPPQKQPRFYTSRLVQFYPGCNERKRNYNLSYKTTRRVS